MAAKRQISIAYPQQVGLPDDVLALIGQAVAAILTGSVGPVQTTTPAGPPVPPAAGGTVTLPDGSTADQGTINVIVDRANAYGVDPILAIATAYQESGLNTHAVGDGGTSFGLYQLHQGGELGNLTPDQAFDGWTNADVALSTFAQFGPGSRYATPGAWAAASQRPADPVGYAASVDNWYQFFAKEQ